MSIWVQALSKLTRRDGPNIAPKLQKVHHPRLIEGGGGVEWNRVAQECGVERKSWEFLGFGLSPLVHFSLVSFRPLAPWLISVFLSGFLFFLVRTFLIHIAPPASSFPLHCSCSPFLVCPSCYHLLSFFILSALLSFSDLSSALVVNPRFTPWFIFTFMLDSLYPLLLVISSAWPSVCADFLLRCFLFLLCPFFTLISVLISFFLLSLFKIFSPSWQLLSSPVLVFHLLSARLSLSC